MTEETEKPLTREDVLSLIKENRGTARGLDLSDKEFEMGIDLSGLVLSGTVLKRIRSFEANFQRTILSTANLEEADLTLADMQYSHLSGTRLKGAKLFCAKLQKAHLEGANLEGACLYGVELSIDTQLQNALWGNYILKEELEGEYADAEVVYRDLRKWYTNAGIYDIAGEFFFREMTAKRRATKWWPNPIPRAWSKFLSLICGYGERPIRVIGWAASVILVSTLIYFIIGSIWEWWAFWNAFYFSAVSFTALGYGSWLEISNDWIKGIGAFESFIGVFTIALFLITFVRKMTR